MIPFLNYSEIHCRKILSYTMDNSLIIMMSEASCFLRNPEVEVRSKQFVKRELGSEIVSFCF